MPDFEFNLPYPPTVNHYHQPVRQGLGVRIIKGAKAREYQAEAVAALGRGSSHYPAVLQWCSRVCCTLTVGKGTG